MHAAFIIDFDAYQFEERINRLIAQLEENGYSIIDVKFQQSIKSDSSGCIIFFSALITYH